MNTSRREILKGFVATLAIAPLAATAKGFPQYKYAKTLVVKPVGGDFPSPRLAVESVVDASRDRVYQILIHPGIYRDIDWRTKDFVDLVGTDVDRCILDGLLPDDHPPEDIANHQTLWGSTNGLIKNLTIRCRNMRYPYHPDVTSPVLAINKTMRLENVKLEHLGNDGAIRYQKGLGDAGKPKSVWRGTHALGSGLASGCSLLAEGCSFIGGRAGFAVHNRPNADKPISIQLTNCTLMSREPGGWALLTESIGSGQNDLVVLNDCVLVGGIHSSTKPWKPTKPDYQPASHIEIKIEGHGNSPAKHTIDDPGRALSIQSRPGVLMPPTLSGGAARLMFGDPVQINNAIEGTIDVAASRFTLGQRLGDCSINGHTLVVTGADAAPVEILFKTDMRAVRNSDVIALINRSLGYEAASLVSPSQRYKIDIE